MLLSAKQCSRPVADLAVTACRSAFHPGIRKRRVPRDRSAGAVRIFTIFIGRRFVSTFRHPQESRLFVAGD